MQGQDTLTGGCACGQRDAEEHDRGGELLQLADLALREVLVATLGDPGSLLSFAFEFPDPVLHFQLMNHLVDHRRSPPDPASNPVFVACTVVVLTTAAHMRQENEADLRL